MQVYHGTFYYTIWIEKKVIRYRDPPNIFKGKILEDRLNTVIEESKVDENTKIWDRKCFEFNIYQ